MSELELRKKVAYLEFVNDQLKAELSHVNDLMHQLGFSNGLETVKDAANEMFQDIPHMEEEEQE